MMEGLAGMAAGPWGLLASVGGGLMSSLLGQDPSQRKRIVDPFTQQANMENQQQKMLNKNLYQQDLAFAGRTADKMINDTGIQSMGAQAQTGMADNATTKALQGMATGNLGSQVLDQSAAATGRYAQGMGATNDFTKSLANDVMYQQASPNLFDKVGSALTSLPNQALNSLYRGRTAKNLTS